MITKAAAGVEIVAIISYNNAMERIENGKGMRRFIGILLLLALFFNTAHAFIIEAADHCDHEKVATYIQEIDHGGDCGDLCDMHHLFHIPAIPITPTPIIAMFPKPRPAEHPLYKHTPPLIKPSYRPPIA